MSTLQGRTGPMLDIGEARYSRAAMALHWIVAAKSLERIADHAKNIAEEVVYLCDAQDIRHTLKN